MTEDAETRRTRIQEERRGFETYLDSGEFHRGFMDGWEGVPLSKTTSPIKQGSRGLMEFVDGHSLALKVRGG